MLLFSPSWACSNYLSTVFHRMHFCVAVPNTGLYWQHGCTQLCCILCTGSMGVLSFATYCLPQAQSTPGACLHWLVSGQRSLKPSLTSKSVSDYNTKRKERQTMRAGHSWRMQSAPLHSCLCRATSAHQPTQLSSTLALLYTLVQQTATKLRLCSCWNSLTGTMIPRYSVLFLLVQSMQKNHPTKRSDTQTHTRTCIHTHTFHTHTHTHTHTHSTHTLTHARTHTLHIHTIHPFIPTNIWWNGRIPL